MQKQDPDNQIMNNEGDKFLPTFVKTLAPYKGD